VSSVTDAPLGRLLREADPATAATFVADLFEARGYAVDRVGDRQVVAESDGETTTIAVDHPDGEPIADGSDVDRVVAVRGLAGDGAAEVVTVTALERQLAYAVNHPVASALLETHFDWTPENGPDGQTRAGTAGGVASGPLQGDGRARALAAVVLVVALLAGSAVALTGTDGRIGDAPNGPDGNAGEAAPTPASGGDEGPTQSADVTATPTPVRTGAAGEGSEPDRYDDAPPGVVGPNRVNIHDAAGAFLDELDGESYQLSIAYREYAGGHFTGAHFETLRVESNERYVADVSRVGRTESRPLTVARVDQYADGSVRYLRFGNGSVGAEPTVAYDPFMFNATQYLGWFLSSENSTIAGRETRGNTTTYRLVTDGDPDPRFTDAHGTVFVTGEGVVRYGRWEYRPGDHPDVRVVFEMQVTDVGSTRVTAPDWVDSEAARTAVETVRTANGTDGGENGTDTREG